MEQKSKKTNESNDKRSIDPGKERHITPSSGKASERIEMLKAVHRSLGDVANDLAKLARTRQKTALACEIAALSVTIALRLLRGQTSSGVRLSLMSQVLTALKAMVEESGGGGAGGTDGEGGGETAPVPAQPAGDPSSMKPKPAKVSRLDKVESGMEI